MTAPEDPLIVYLEPQRVVVLVIKGAEGQTGDLLEFRDDKDLALGGIDCCGRLSYATASGNLSPDTTGSPVGSFQVMIDGQPRRVFYY